MKNIVIIPDGNLDITNSILQTSKIVTALAEGKGADMNYVNSISHLLDPEQSSPEYIGSLGSNFNVILPSSIEIIFRVRGGRVTDMIIIRS